MASGSEAKSCVCAGDSGGRLGVVMTASPRRDRRSNRNRVRGLRRTRPPIPVRSDARSTAKQSTLDLCRFCVRPRIAHESGHSSCTALSDAKDCNGVVKVYRSRPTLTRPRRGQRARAPRTQRDADANGEEPATVADMTKDTLDKSRENMRKAGEAVDNAGKARPRSV